MGDLPMRSDGSLERGFGMFPVTSLPCSLERPLKGDYGEEAAHLLALNHRESASYRWRYLWRAVLTPETSDCSTDVSFSGRRITLGNRPSALILVNIST